MSFKRYSNPLDLESCALRVNQALVARNQLTPAKFHDVQSAVPVPLGVIDYPWGSRRWSRTPCTLINLTCVGEAGPRLRKADVITMKSFYDLADGGLGGKRKEELFWKVAAEDQGSEAALILMRFKSSAGALGYDSWALPNGKVVGLAEMRIIQFVLESPGPTTVIHKFSERGNSWFTCPQFDRPLDPFQRSSDEDARVEHYILGFNLGLERFVLDPISLKFGLRREGHLAWFGSWEEYVQILPGTVSEIAGWGLSGDENDVMARVLGKRFAFALKIKYQGKGYMKKVEASVLENLGQPACSFCGMIQEEEDDLKTCSHCKGTRYCDKWCQKSGWKAHREACLS